MTPAETIRQAQEKANMSLTIRCQPEMTKIVNIFSKETGLPIKGINVQIIDVTTIGSLTPETVIGHLTLSYRIPL